MVKKPTKSKKRRTFAAEKHNSKTRIDTGTKTNPFDLHVNRLKHDVLGKRRNYEKGGQPLKSRSRGIEKVIFLCNFIFRFIFLHRENVPY
jgi:hypothetical protein